MNFSAADRAMSYMNRRNLREFGKLKQLKFDNLNVLGAVNSTYDESVRAAIRRYKEIAILAFIEAMVILGYDREKAKEEAEDSITEDWILDMLEEYDPVTLYQFFPEAERKKQRLVEALIAAHNKGQEIDKALRLWTLQLAHYADQSVVNGTIDGYKSVGVGKVKWIAVDDEKTCPECRTLDGKVFDIDKVPDRPHYRCRCVLEPVK